MHRAGRGWDEAETEEEGRMSWSLGLGGKGTVSGAGRDTYSEEGRHKGRERRAKEPLRKKRQQGVLWAGSSENGH